MLMCSSKLYGNADRLRSAVRASHRGVEIRALNAPLDLANALQIIAHRRLIPRAQLQLQRTCFGRDLVQNAAILLGPQRAIRRRSALPEHPLEGLARIDLHRHRRGVRAPRKRVHVNAAVVAIAGAQQRRVIFGRQFNRRQRRVLPDMLRRNLVRRDPRVRVHALGRLRPHSAQPSGRTQRMHRRAVGRAITQSAHDIQAIPERLQRLQYSAKTRTRRPPPRASTGP